MLLSGLSGFSPRRTRPEEGRGLLTVSRGVPRPTLCRPIGEKIGQLIASGEQFVERIKLCARQSGGKVLHAFERLSTGHVAFARERVGNLERDARFDGLHFHRKSQRRFGKFANRRPAREVGGIAERSESTPITKGNSPSFCRRRAQRHSRFERRGARFREMNF